MSLKDDIRIDKDALDYEWGRQASLFYKHSCDWADAIYDRDQLKDALAVVSAELDADIRENYERYGFERKPTEPAIKAWIQSQDQYKEANSEYIQAVREVNYLVAAKEALDHKKVALQKLTDLYLANYYAEPMVRRKARDAYKGDKAANEAQEASSGIDRVKKLKRKKHKTE